MTGLPTHGLHFLDHPVERQRCISNTSDDASNDNHAAQQLRYSLKIRRISGKISSPMHANSPNFAIFHRIWQLWKHITSQCLMIDPGYNACRISSSTFGQNWPTQQSHGLSAI